MLIEWLYEWMNGMFLAMEEHAVCWGGQTFKEILPSGKSGRTFGLSMWPSAERWEVRDIWRVSGKGFIYIFWKKEHPLFSRTVIISGCDVSGNVSESLLTEGNSQMGKLICWGWWWKYRTCEISNTRPALSLNFWLYKI